MSLSTRSIEINIKKLIDLNWIGYKKKDKKAYIRSFNTLMVNCEKKSYMAAEFHFKDLQSIRAFLTAAVIGKLVQHQKRKLIGENGTEVRIKGRTIQSAFSPIVSNLALSKILDISISTAFLWKKDAQRCGYINIKKGLDFLGIRKEEIGHYRKYCSNRVRVIKNRTYLQNSDMVWSNLFLKKRRKSKHIRGVGKGRLNDS